MAASFLFAGSASAALQWEPIGPVPTSVGFTAVASDPQDPRVVWIAGASSVWVSDDGGDTFSLVLQLSRAASVERAAADGITVQSDPEDPSVELPPEGSENTEDIDNIDDIDDPSDPDQVDPSVVDPTTGEIEPNSSQTDAAETEADTVEFEGGVLGSDPGSSQVRFGVTRIRVLQDSVLICTARGLWTLPRSARKIGEAREIRLGRRVAVSDVTRGFEGLLYAATDAGLWQVGSDGIARSVIGFGANDAMTAIVRLGRRMVVATDKDLYIQEGDGFRKMGILTGRERVSDLTTLDGMRLVAVANQKVLLILAPPAQAPLVEASWSVPGATRVARGRDEDALWATGSRGSWQFAGESGWVRRDEGLLDRRLFDVAASASGPAFLYVVGRGGAARLVPETARIWNKRAEFQARRALEGLPTIEETLEWASEARPIQLSDVDSWETEQSLSWLLPNVRLRYRLDRAREENFLFIPAVGRRILDEVAVTPEDDQFRIEARWNLMPALMMTLETSPSLRSARSRARRAQGRIRSTVLPLYNTWLQRRVKLVASEYTSVREAVRDLLAIQQMEADLHVYTDGSFPIIGVTKPSAPSK
ncbi:MAG: hypothetical protein ACI9MR_001432 [Myxococcota bacterium]|jgi:hypothetical protein